MSLKRQLNKLDDFYRNQQVNESAVNEEGDLKIGTGLFLD
jgi:hypothetical protein